MSKKILIIKLGAKGDVVRTLPLLIEIKEKYPDSEIIWITKSQCREILETSPYISKILALPINFNELPEKFDALFNFDMEEDAAQLADKIKSDKKYGFFMENGYPSAFNFPSEYYLNTLFDDELKKKNKKTYQEMMFEVAELSYKKQHHPLYLTEKDKEYSKDFASKNNIDAKNLIGIHIGSSPRWPSKAWHQERIKEFITKAKENGYSILLFGGPDESERHEKFAEELNQQGIKIFRNNPSNTDKEFFSLMNLCSKIICSDSFALHVSLSLKKPTVCLFFCTSPDEVEDYGILKKIISPKIYDFFPERQDEYNEELTKSISADEVLSALLENSVRVVNAIVKHPKENKFLTIKRKKGIHSGKWAFPGGIVETGESNEIALKRELKEETGLELLKIIKKISDYSYSRPEGRNTQGNSYLIEVKDERVSINEESSEYRWVTIEEFEELDHIEGLEEEIFNSIYL